MDLEAPTPGDILSDLFGEPYISRDCIIFWYLPVERSGIVITYPRDPIESNYCKLGSCNGDQGALLTS